MTLHVRQEDVFGMQNELLRNYGRVLAFCGYIWSKSLAERALLCLFANFQGIY